MESGNRSTPGHRHIVLLLPDSTLDQLMLCAQITFRCPKYDWAKKKFRNLIELLHEKGATKYYEYLTHNYVDNLDTWLPSAFPINKATFQTNMALERFHRFVF